MTVVDPIRDERGWAFREGPGHTLDPVNGFQFLREAYEASGAKFKGRVTVPVLWDKEAHVVVNNSEDDICRMFNGVFSRFGDATVELFPTDLAREQDARADMQLDSTGDPQPVRAHGRRVVLVRLDDGNV